MTDEAKLNNLAAQPDSALRTEFLDQVRGFVSDRVGGETDRKVRHEV